MVSNPQIGLPQQSVILVSPPAPNTISFPPKLSKYLVQLDHKNNCAFLCMYKSQSVDKTRVEKIFNLLKSQQVIRENCRCFGTLLSLKKESGDIYKGGTQLIAKDDNTPDETLVIVVKHLELMRTELQQLARSSLKTAQGSNNNSNNIQGKVLEQQQLSRKRKKEDDAANNDNSMDTREAEPTPVQSTPKVFVLKSNKNNPERNASLGSNTKLIKLGNTGKYIAVSNAGNVASDTMSKILVKAQKSLHTQTTVNTVEETNFSDNTECSATADSIKRKRNETETSHSNVQDDNILVSNPEAHDTNASVLKCWESRLKKENVMPNDHWVCNSTTNPNNLTKRILNIYELGTDTNSGKLEIFRSIQVKEDATISISIDSKECTDNFLNQGDCMYSFQDLLKIIRDVDNHQLCKGCDAIENSHTNDDDDAKGFFDGSTWFSINCLQVIRKTESATHKCVNCEKLETTHLNI